MKASIFFIVFFLFPYLSVADSIAVAPTSINLEEGQRRSIFIINPGEEKIGFVIEHNLAEGMEISISEGEIEPESKKEINITLEKAPEKDGIYSLIISKEGTGIRPGVKVEVRAKGENDDEKNNGKLLITIMIGAVAAASLAILFRK